MLGRVTVDRLGDGGAGGEVVGLGEQGDAGATGPGDATAVDLAGADEGCQQRGLACAVGAQDADAASSWGK